MWTEKLFRVKKPIIAMLHFRELPGDPFFKHTDSMEQVIRYAREELHALQDGGVDGILFADEFSLPYEKKVSYVTVAAMARIIGELHTEVKLPYGVNISQNPLAAIELAAAVDAQFVRAPFTGAYLSDAGFIDTDVAAVLRRRRALGIEDLKLLFKVNPESDAYLVERSIEKITHSVIFHCRPDALCVSGESAGKETDSGLISRVKKVAVGIPVFCNTGTKKENVVDKLNFCDGCIVGTVFKKDGKFENFVEAKRVREFMDVVREYRKTLG